MKKLTSFLKNGREKIILLSADLTFNRLLIKKCILLFLLPIIFFAADANAATTPPTTPPTTPSGGGSAGSLGSLTDMLCKINTIFTGAPGQIITTFVIIIVATGAFFGKANWQTVIVVGICVCVYFSADQIVGFIVAKNVHKC